MVAEAGTPRTATAGTAPGPGGVTYGPWGPAAIPRTLRAVERLLLDRCQETVIALLGERVTVEDAGQAAVLRGAIAGHVAEYGRWAAQTAGGAWQLVDPADTVRRLYDDLLGLSILQPLMDDPAVEEIICNGPMRLFVKRPLTERVRGVYFADAATMLVFAKRLVAMCGERLDESRPFVDGRLPDGSRLNVTIPPAAVDFPCLTIRKFLLRASSLAELVDLGTLPQDAADFLEAAFRARVNVLVSGGTATGKTTLVNALGNALDADADRVITIEETPELQLARSLPNCVALAARRENIEGAGETTIRDLVRNALRMTPTRIIVGEVRGAEALDMLGAMNTGHDGSCCTIHANNPRQALQKLATFAMMAEERLPRSALGEIIADTVELVVQLKADQLTGTRRVTHIYEVTGLEGDTIQGQELWGGGSASGRLGPTGIAPRCLAKIADAGIAYRPPRVPA